MGVEASRGSIKGEGVDVKTWGSWGPESVVGSHMEMRILAPTRIVVSKGVPSSFDFR